MGQRSFGKQDSLLVVMEDEDEKSDSSVVMTVELVSAGTSTVSQEPVFGRSLSFGIQST